MDRGGGGVVAQTSRTPHASHYDKEAGSMGRYNAEQAIQAATAPSQAYSQMDRGRICTERNGATEELNAVVKIFAYGVKIV